MTVRALLAAATAVAAVAAPAAADHHRVECGFETVPDGTAYEVVVYGVVTGAPGDTVSLSCEVYAGPDLVVATAHRPGTGAAVTYGRASSTPGGFGPDYVCEVSVVNGVTDRRCIHVDVMQVPPQAVYDALYAVLEFVDAVTGPVDLTWLCPLLSALAGGYGPIAVNSQGDVFLGGEPYFDCPPYDQWG